MKLPGPAGIVDFRWIGFARVCAPLMAGLEVNLELCMFFEAPTCVEGIRYGM